MREQKQNNIIKNFGQAKKLALLAVNRYLGGSTIMGDRDGLYHDGMGRKRAAKLKQYLESIDDQDHIALLAVFIAIFGKPDTAFITCKSGRSSRLAGLITEAWVQGTNDRYTSEVFSNAALKIGEKYSELYAPVEESPWSLYNKAMRELLQQALNQPEFSQNLKLIEVSIKALQKLFNSSSRKIDLTILPSTRAMDEVYVASATIGALSQTIIPRDALIKISSGLTRTDVARTLITINRAAFYSTATVGSMKRNQPSHSMMNFCEPEPIIKPAIK